MMEVLDYYQRVEKKPWLLDHCSPIIGIREGCRIVGDYILKVKDLRAGRAFEDGVARGTFYLDAHKPDDEKRTYILSERERGSAVSDTASKSDCEGRQEPDDGRAVLLGRPVGSFLRSGEHIGFDDGAGGGNRGRDEHAEKM
jgi:hypothetical protein